MEQQNFYVMFGSEIRSKLPDHRGIPLTSEGLRDRDGLRKLSQKDYVHAKRDAVDSQVVLEILRPAEKH